MIELACEALDNHDALYRRSKDIAAKALPTRLRRRSRPDEDRDSGGRSERHSYDDRHGDSRKDEYDDRYDNRYGDINRRNKKRDDRPANDPRGVYAQSGRRASSFDNGDYGRDSRRDRSDRSRRGSNPGRSSGAVPS